jgi:hypothetical protein
MDVQTSAPEADLFASETHAPAAAIPAAQMTFTGRVHSARVATKPCDREGHMVPVLVLELHDVGPGHHVVTAHVPYTDATRNDAEQMARQLRRDQVVEVTTPLTDVRLFLPAASISTPTTPA